MGLLFWLFSIAFATAAFVAISRRVPQLEFRNRSDSNCFFLPLFFFLSLFLSSFSLSLSLSLSLFLSHLVSTMATTRIFQFGIEPPNIENTNPNPTQHLK